MGLNIFFSITHTHLKRSLSTSLNCFPLVPDKPLEVHDKKLVEEMAEGELDQSLNNKLHIFHYISVSLFVVMYLMENLVTQKRQIAAFPMTSAGLSSK